MRRSITKVALLIAVVVCAMLVVALPAMADSVYHSQHIALKPVGCAPLHKGFVENIHANGPTIFALERYVLVGAKPRTQFQVTLVLRFAPDQEPFAALGTTKFWTNGVGNGVGHVTLAPSAAEGLHGMTIYIVWELSSAKTGKVMYHSGLETVTLD